MSFAKGRSHVPVLFSLHRPKMSIVDRVACPFGVAGDRMTAKHVILERVSYGYDAMPELLLKEISTSFSEGWTGIVGANGAGKTTLLKLATGLLEPREGHIRIPGDALYCAQRTDVPPARLGLLIDSADRFASEIKGRLGIAGDFLPRWPSLSHGERKRAQIGVMLWQQPSVLALDEPTNHIDEDARALLIPALRSFRGIGMLVSHDRDLLDLLCHHCLFVDPPDAVMRPGNYSAGRRESLREEESSRRRKESAKRQTARLATEAARRASEARNSDSRRSKRGLDPKDHDRRARIDLARLTGTDGRAGMLAGQMRSRVEKALQAERSIKIRKHYELGIWLEGERCRRDALFRICASSIPLGSGRELHCPDLAMLPSDRIALTGANGAGKSTLVRRIVGSLNLPVERLTYLPQEIDLPSSCRILEEVRRQPPDILGMVMTIVSRLGSRPARLIESVEPSPGEVRKLMLALGIARRPHLIVMDEPTNHLDLPSIECLEEALKGCPCGLLLVSHDERFLRALTGTRWHLAPVRTSSPPGQQGTDYCVLVP
jgi:ATPase subunit of ABC transporter with duplicated ATPase domains